VCGAFLIVLMSYCPVAHADLGGAAHSIFGQGVAILPRDADQTRVGFRGKGRPRDVDPRLAVASFPTGPQPEERTPTEHPQLPGMSMEHTAEQNAVPGALLLSASASICDVLKVPCRQQHDEMTTQPSAEFTPPDATAAGMAGLLAVARGLQQGPTTTELTPPHATAAGMAGLLKVARALQQGAGSLDSQAEPALRVTRNDRIMRKGWDTSPIVLPSHRLLLFTIPKVGCTVLKQLARRIMGLPDWQRGDDEIPHDPAKNGLRYLNQYSLAEATAMMRDPCWTRAVFVRDPHERVLSAYLDKVVNTDYVKRRFGSQPTSFAEFVQMPCVDPHWAPQRSFIDQAWWPSIDVVGHLETAAADAEKLLRRVGAWDAYGASEWGGGGAIFAHNQMPERATQTAQCVREHYDDAVWSAVSEKYRMDLEFCRA
jgi:hypothetical protein